jgi:hypothetical protein
MELNIFSILMVDLRSKLNTLLIWLNNELDTSLSSWDYSDYFTVDIFCRRVVFLGLICLLVCMLWQSVHKSNLVF